MDALTEHVYEDFQVASLIMKIQKEAGERQKLIREYQFVDAKEECNISLEDYIYGIVKKSRPKGRLRLHLYIRFIVCH